MGTTATKILRALTHTVPRRLGDGLGPFAAAPVLERKGLPNTKDWNPCLSRLVRSSFGWLWTHRVFSIQIHRNVLWASVGPRAYDPALGLECRIFPQYSRLTCAPDRK